MGDDQPPPDPGEYEDPDLTDIELSEDEKPDEHDRGDADISIDAIGVKILERAEREASDLLPPLPPPATPPPGISGDRRPLDGVGPSGRLIPKGDSEEPGEIIKILKEKNLAPEGMERWGSGMMGDGKIYLNDDGEACKIDKRGVPYKVGSDGRRILSSRRPIHKYTPEEWKKMGEAEKKAAYEKDKRDKARSAKKERKKAAMGKKVISKVLEQMIFPKIVQCSAVDLKLNTPVDDDDAWAWAQEMSDAYAQDMFLADVIPAAPAHMVFDENWIPSMPCATSVILEHREKNPAVKSCFNAMVTRPVTRKEMMSNPKAMEAFMKEWKGLWDQEVFDFTTTREYDDVVAEAKKKGEKVHMARVHGLIYEKNYQLKEDDPARKFQGTWRT